LNAAEIRRAVATLRQAGRLTPESRFGTITVEPRSKSRPEPRAARILGFDWSRNEGFVAVVDIDAGRVESWTVVDSEPPMRLLTIRRAEEIAHADPRWVAALRTRNIDTARECAVGLLTCHARFGTSMVNAAVFLRDGPADALSIPGLSLGVNLTQAVDQFFAPGSARRRDSASRRALAAPRAAHSAPTNSRRPSARVTGNEISGSLALSRLWTRAEARDSRCLICRR
jgi:hypothetical protein